MDEMSISDLMMRDHERIEQLLEELAGGGGSLENLKWELERHFFVEEKATFNIQGIDSVIDSDAILRLMKDHDAIMMMLHDMEDAGPNEMVKMAAKLQSMISKHSNFEDEKFYPGLDRNLSKVQKAVIFARIHDIHMDFERTDASDDKLVPRVRFNPVTKTVEHKRIKVDSRVIEH